MTNHIIDSTLSANGSVTGTATVDGIFRIAATNNFGGGTLIGYLTPVGHSVANALTDISYTNDNIEDTVRLTAGDVLTLTLTGATSPSIKVTVTQVG